MIRQAPRTRSGITLTEILISILIMGVGVVSLATLFPLGLVRLRNAQRLTRGAFLVESAISDLGSRNLLNQFSFTDKYVSPWYQTATTGGYNPWVQDTPAYGLDWKDNSGGGADGVGAFAGPGNLPTRRAGPGLPVAYDPLWRAVTGIYADPLKAVTPEARFGMGVGWLRPDGGLTPSAHGLQRVTNLQASYQGGATVPASLAAFQATAAQVRQNTLTVLSAFVSPEDIVLQDPKGTYADPNNPAGPQLGSPSPLVPEMNAAFNSDNEWRFSWLFTGQQSDLFNGTMFDGDIVICENRPFGMEPTGGPYPGSTPGVTGETVVEAVWGYSSSPGKVLPGVTDSSGNPVGYGNVSASRSVWLRWPSTMADPDVKVGSFICDVTYERSAPIVRAGRFPGIYQPQRCNWYQVAKKTEVTEETVALGGEVGTYRRMNVWVTTPLRAQSLLSFPGGGPAVPTHVEAALIMPSVVNVYPRTVYTR